MEISYMRADSANLSKKHSKMQLRWLPVSGVSRTHLLWYHKKPVCKGLTKPSAQLVLVSSKPAKRRWNNDSMNWSGNGQLPLLNGRCQAGTHQCSIGILDQEINVGNHHFTATGSGKVWWISKVYHDLPERREMAGEGPPVAGRDVSIRTPEGPRWNLSCPPPYAIPEAA